MIQLWYLGRAVPWTVLLGCAAAATVVGLVVERWPESSLLLLPMLLACFVVAATFSFDERALAVVEVTPRGGSWRRSLRLGVGLAPGAAWLVALALDPGGLSLGPGDWGLVGLAAVAVGAAAASLLSGREVASPGGILAPWVVLALCAPVVVSLFLGVGQIYPYDQMGSARVTWWGVAAAGGALVAAASLRPGVRR